MTGRERVRRFFRRQPTEGVPFLPLAFYQASRIDGAPAGELIAEPPRLARAALELSRLLRSDAVAVRLEAAAFAACGIDLAWPAPDGPPTAAGAPATAPDAAGLIAAAGPPLAAIEALKGELRGEKPALAVLPGPAAFAARFAEEAARTAALAALRGLADAACKAGAEVVVLAEDEADDEARLKRLAGPIVNTVRYYTATAVLALPQPAAGRIADAQIVPAAAASGAPATGPLGVMAGRAELADRAARTALAEAIAARAGTVFLSLDDAAIAGLEFPDIDAAVGTLLGRA